jgi:hypothetical protein
MTRKQVADLIRRFLDGTCGNWEWDDFLSVARFDDERLRQIQVICDGLPNEFPPPEKGHYCNAHGLAILRRYAEELDPGGTAK